MKLFTFTLKYTNKYGGASYKATDSRDTATIYISPNAFSGKPVKEIRIVADEGIVDPAAVVAAQADALAQVKAEKEAKKLARKAEAAARKEAKKAKAKKPTPAPTAKKSTPKKMTITSRAKMPKNVKPNVTLTPAPALAEVVNG